MKNNLFRYRMTIKLILKLEVTHCFEMFLFSFSMANKSPTVRLIQDIYDDLMGRSKENREAILTIKSKVEVEISSLRNMSYQLFGGADGKSTSINKFSYWYN